MYIVVLMISTIQNVHNLCMHISNTIIIINKPSNLFIIKYENIGKYRHFKTINLIKKKQTNKHWKSIYKKIQNNNNHSQTSLALWSRTRTFFF